MDERQEAGRAAAGRTSDLGRRLAIVDVVALLVGWSAGCLAGTAGTDWPLLSPTTGVGMIIVGVVATVASFSAAGLYRPPVNGVRSGALGRMAQATAMAGVVVIVWQGLVGDTAPRVALSAVAVALATSVVVRCGFDVWLVDRREAGEFSTPVVVAGVANETAALVDFLRLNPEAGLCPTAIVGERLRSGGPPWTGGYEQVLDAVHRTGAGGVLVAVNGLPSDTVTGLVDDVTSAGVAVQLSTGLTGVSRSRLQTLALAHEPMVLVNPPRQSAIDGVAKRALDILLASLLLLLAAPVVAVAAVAIKVHDGGPVLFRQVRLGRHGRPFTVLKLRTMEVEAEARLGDLRDRNERHGPLFKMSDDPRITPIGSFLRSTAIDELPQLLNVLTGRMSIVGPRPALPEEAAQFDDELQRRHLVRPGVTGLWQVEANRKASFDEYRRLDLFYVDNWSFIGDVAVIVDTLQVISRRILRALRRPATGVAPVRPSPVPDSVELRS